MKRERERVGEEEEEETEGGFSLHKEIIICGSEEQARHFNPSFF